MRTPTPLAKRTSPSSRKARYADRSSLAPARSDWRPARPRPWGRRAARPSGHRDPDWPGAPAASSPAGLARAAPGRSSLATGAVPRPTAAGRAAVRYGEERGAGSSTCRTQAPRRSPAGSSTRRWARTANRSPRRRATRQAPGRSPSRGDPCHPGSPRLVQTLTSPAHQPATSRRGDERPPRRRAREPSRAGRFRAPPRAPAGRGIASSGRRRRRRG